MINALEHEISPALCEHLGMEPYQEERMTEGTKLVDSLEEAINRSGLRDGMTISFHHHFRNGDYIVNTVVKKLAEMGFHNLKIAPSSLSDCHAPLVEYIKSGVVNRIETSGLRGELANQISHGLMEEPVIFRSHGGRAAAIKNGELHIDVAFLGASTCDELGNANGTGSEEDGTVAACGSLGYAKVDARYADQVIILTDHLVPAPNKGKGISGQDVDYVVKVDAIGDASKISSGATRFTKNPRDLLIAETTAKVVINSGYFVDGFSLQTGSGGASLAVTRFIRDEMIARGIKASFGLGGITGQMVSLHEEGLIQKLFDVQSFDSSAADSMRRNPNHFEVDGNEYASPYDKAAIINQLDVVILSALEIDTGFNVNVLTGSDGVIRGAIGGHPDTAAGAKLSILVTPLIRGRIPCIVDKVISLITPGSTVDVVVTDQGVAVNPARPEVAQCLKKAGIKLTTLEALKEKAEQVVGKPDPLPFGERVVGVVTSRDGKVLDVIHEIKD